MTQEDKELLLKDLCARLPYKIMVKVNDTQGIMDEIDIPNERIFVSSLNPFLYGGAKASWFTVNGDKIKPYLRPMSSMTEEEKEELKKLCEEDLSEFAGFIKSGHGLSHDGLYMFDKLRQLEFCLSRHLDFRGLIEKGLALQAPEGMYK